MHLCKFYLNFNSCGYFEIPKVLLSSDLYPTKGSEVLSHPLGVEQEESVVPQEFYQSNERDLGGVGFPGKHALAEECFSQYDAIEATL